MSMKVSAYSVVFPSIPISRRHVVLECKGPFTIEAVEDFLNAERKP